jgi:hypothetical protein
MGDFLIRAVSQDLNTNLAWTNQKPDSINYPDSLFYHFKLQSLQKKLIVPLATSAD